MYSEYRTFKRSLKIHLKSKLGLKNLRPPLVNVTVCPRNLSYLKIIPGAGKTFLSLERVHILNNLINRHVWQFYLLHHWGGKEKRIPGTCWPVSLDEAVSMWPSVSVHMCTDAREEPWVLFLRLCLPCHLWPSLLSSRFCIPLNWPILGIHQSLPHQSYKTSISLESLKILHGMLNKN